MLYFYYLTNYVKVIGNVEVFNADLKNMLWKKSWNSVPQKVLIFKVARELQKLIHSALWISKKA